MYNSFIRSFGLPVSLKSQPNMVRFPFWSKYFVTFRDNYCEYFISLYTITLIAMALFFIGFNLTRWFLN